MFGMNKSFSITDALREEQEMGLARKLGIVAKLSMPGILAQIAEILMQYIDAAMVGGLGAEASASIGVVASTTWLFGSLNSACVAGFSVQVAHAIGAGDDKRARSIFRQSLIVTTCMALVLLGIGMAVGQVLPQWLGADPAIHDNARKYFMIYSMFLPVRTWFNLMGQMLQRSGNMKIPSILTTLMCLLDVVFNYFLIFPTRQVILPFGTVMMPGAGMGVLGAQLGTSLSFAVCAACLAYYAVIRSDRLALIHEKASWMPRREVLSEAARIGVPMAFEQSALSLAQVVQTKIVAPLGTIALAANSFAVTAESICYMPGYGISSAATTLVGQSFGARRRDLAESFAWLTTFVGIAVMSLTGIVMYFICPAVFAFLTPVKEVQELGVKVLRIELFAEPMFAASIVATGSLRGAGDTFVPGILNLVSIWGVRITLAWLLTKTMGLPGAWIAMAAELNFRGILFLIRMKRGKWLDRMDA